MRKLLSRALVVMAAALHRPAPIVINVYGATDRDLGDEIDWVTRTQLQ